MKGLLVKDLELMKVQKKFFIMVLAVGALLNFSSSGAFAVGYFTFVCATFVTSTVSYDEFENGLVFLMTLPVSRRDYAVSKYIFGGAVVVCSWILGMAVSMACAAIKGESFGVDGIAMLPIGLLIVALMLPFMIKFGQEKGRYVSVGVLGAAFAALFAVLYYFKRTGGELDMLLGPLESIGLPAMIGGVCAVTVLLYALSCAISIRIMNNREM